MLLSNDKIGIQTAGNKINMSFSMSNVIKFWDLSKDFFQNCFRFAVKISAKSNFLHANSLFFAQRFVTFQQLKSNELEGDMYL